MLYVRAELVFYEWEEGGSPGEGRLVLSRFTHLAEAVPVGSRVDFGDWAITVKDARYLAIDPESHMKSLEYLISYTYSLMPIHEVITVATLALDHGWGLDWNMSTWASMVDRLHLGREKGSK
jgi:hypothetical protein